MRGPLQALTILIAVSALAGGCDTSVQQSNQALSSGVAAIQAGQTSRGISDLEIALGFDPDNAVAHYYLGMVRLQELHDADSAHSALQRAAELLPDEAEVSYQLGVAESELGRTDQARAAFEAAIAADPEHGRALYRLARLDEADGEIRTAIDTLTRAIYATPRLSIAYNALGNLYLRYGRPQEAMQVLQNGIENENRDDPDSAVARGANRADLGRVYMELGEYDLAVTVLRQAAEMRTNASTEFNLGVAYRERWHENRSDADREAAIRHLRRARGSCNVGTELARCESIEAALNELASDDPDEADDE